METLMKRKKQIETGDIIRKAIGEWYFEHGMSEPNWKVKDEEWWIEYLKSLDKEEG